MAIGTVTDVFEFESGDSAAFMVMQSGVFEYGDLVSIHRDGIVVEETRLYPVRSGSSYTTPRGEVQALFKNFVCQVGDTVESVRTSEVHPQSE
ncbi:hypothetical protein ACTD5D_20910 [Nocardia takedensis]|uniref:hypothetical protein n=1 Tax=Nocardia takedensis TaxID=259390 RepID=UPI003F777164